MEQQNNIHKFLSSPKVQRTKPNYKNDIISQTISKYSSKQHSNNLSQQNENKSKQYQFQYLSQFHRTNPQILLLLGNRIKGPYSSKERYDDLCRIQALKYAEEVHQALYKHIQLINKNVQQKRKMLKNHLQKQKENIRLNLIRLIDETLQEWEKSQLQYYKSKQMQYFGALIELQAIFKQQIARIQTIKIELKNEFTWKQCANQLLGQTFQSKIIILQQQCHLEKQNCNFNMQMICLENNERIIYILNKINSNVSNYEIKTAVKNLLKIDLVKKVQRLQQKNNNL